MWLFQVGCHEEFSCLPSTRGYERILSFCLHRGSHAVWWCSSRRQEQHLVSYWVIKLKNQGPVSIKRPSYLRMAISMLKIRRPLGRLIFNMGIAIPGKTVFLIETAPRFWPVWVCFRYKTDILAAWNKTYLYSARNRGLLFKSGWVLNLSSVLARCDWWIHNFHIRPSGHCPSHSSAIMMAAG